MLLKWIKMGFLYKRTLLAGLAVGLILSILLGLKGLHTTYEASTQIQLRTKSKNWYNGAALSMIFESGGKFSPAMSALFSNSMEILNSQMIMQEVVKDKTLYIRYFKVNWWGEKEEWYGRAPLKVEMDAEVAEQLKAPVKLEITKDKEGAMHLKASFWMEKQEECETTLDGLPMELQLPCGKLCLKAGDLATADADDWKCMEVVVNRPSAMARQLHQRVRMEQPEKLATLLVLKLEDNCKDRALDVLNGMMTCFSDWKRADMAMMRARAMDFIEQRIRVMDGQIDSIGNELMRYKQQHNVLFIPTELMQAISSTELYKQKLAGNLTQMEQMKMINEDLLMGVTDKEMLPGMAQAKQGNLQRMVARFNAKSAERKVLLRSMTPDNPTMMALDKELEGMAEEISRTSEALRKGLEIRQDELKKTQRGLSRQVKAMPVQEQELLGFIRQFKVMEHMYLLLSNQLELNRTTMDTLAEYIRVIDAPMVMPKKKLPWGMMLLITELLAIAVTVGIIFLNKKLHYKLESEEELKQLTQVPLLGHIRPAAALKSGPIVIDYHTDNKCTEEFIRLRANLHWVLEKGEQVVAISSLSPMEGKSLCACNLAVCQATIDKEKKVVLVETNLRMPSMKYFFGDAIGDKGLTNLLSGAETCQLKEVCKPLKGMENLYVLPAGEWRPNPTELLAGDAFKELMTQLREQFDYIVLDTAPMELWSDTIMALKQADICLWVCRTKVTQKADLAHLNKINQAGLLPKPGIILNE